MKFVKLYALTYNAYLSNEFQVSAEAVHTKVEANELKKVYKSNGHTNVKIVTLSVINLVR